MSKISVDNQNFVQIIRTLNTQSFSEKPVASIIFDKLKKPYRKYLLDNELPKKYLEITVLRKPNTPAKQKELSELKKKYKHQLTLLYGNENIQSTLRKVFIKGDRKKVLEELQPYENRHILAWLQSTSMKCPQLTTKLSQYEKHVYSPYFKQLVVYGLEGINCVPTWNKR